jgi:hypothetical protein
MRWQVLDRRQLHPVEGDMGCVEIHSRDLGGLCHQIARYIAPARCDGDYMISPVDAQGVHVDDRILPNLGINEAAEKNSEQALKRAFASKRLIVVNGDRKLFA